MHITPQPPMNPPPGPAGAYYYQIQPFASGQTLARVAIGFLVLGAILDLVGIASSMAQLDLLYALLAGQTVPPERLKSNDLRQAAIGGLQVLAYLGTVVSFLVWIYRANRNLPSLGVYDPEFTPRWSVGWFFIPFANLIKPFQVVQEIWRGSNPEIGPNELANWRSANASILINIWWGSWLFSNFVGNILLKAAFGKRDSVNDFIGLTWAMIAGDVLSIVAAAFALSVVKKVDGMQTEKHHMLLAAYSPPSSGNLYG